MQPQYVLARPLYDRGWASTLRPLHEELHSHGPDSVSTQMIVTYESWCVMGQSVAVWCSVLQCGAVSRLQRAASD